VDVQNDFCHPGGALPIKDGDRIVPVLNRWVEAAEKAGPCLHPVIGIRCGISVSKVREANGHRTVLRRVKGLTFILTSSFLMES
jgi:hypothetical protein